MKKLLLASVGLSSHQEEELWLIPGAKAVPSALFKSCNSTVRLGRWFSQSSSGLAGTGTGKQSPGLMGVLRWELEKWLSCSCRRSGSILAPTWWLQPSVTPVLGGSDALFGFLWALRSHVVHVHIYRQSTHRH